uniref:Uncharacterized protein n=1 Tax=Rhizophora mucronata TaxID=61149 RepID=A0A2P2NWX6_RHIMU
MTDPLKILWNVITRICMQELKQKLCVSIHYSKLRIEN